MQERFLAMLAIAIAGAVSTTAAPANCDRKCLQGFVDSYLDAMARHDASQLPAAATAKFTENGKVLKLGDGFWKTAGPATYRLYAIDPSHGDAAAQAVVKENGEPVIFLVRLKVLRHKIQEAETLVCRKGEAGFFAPEKLTAAPAIFAQPVPESERSTREQLISIADAYFSAVQNEGTKNYRAAPLAAEVNRYENGEQTTNVPVLGQPAMSASEQLDKGAFRGLTIDHRRFAVADLENGVVMGLVLMHANVNGKATGILIAEMFKVSGAKIRRIQAVMVNTSSDGPTGWN